MQYAIIIKEVITAYHLVFTTHYISEIGSQRIFFEIILQFIDVLLWLEDMALYYWKLDNMVLYYWKLEDMVLYAGHLSVN